MNRFVTQAYWDVKKLEERIAQLGLQLMDDEEPLFLSLDDTLCEKTGRKMGGAGWQHSSTEQRQLWGHSLLFGLVSHAQGKFPCGVALYRKKEDCLLHQIPFRSKIELAEEIVDKFSPCCGQEVTVLGNAWYFCKDLVGCIEAKGYRWIFASKSNWIIYRQGHKTKLSRLAKRVKLSEYKRVRIRGRIFWVFSEVVEIPKIGKVLLVLNRERTKGKKPLGCPRFLVTGCLDLPAEKVLQLYLNRFQIELFFKEAKGHLGLDQYQMRRADGVLIGASLVSAAYLLLVRLNARLPKRHRMKTIGEIIAWIQKRTFEESLLWAHRQGLRYRSKNVIYERLAA